MPPPNKTPPADSGKPADPSAAKPAAAAPEDPPKKTLASLLKEWDDNDKPKADPKDEPKKPDADARLAALEAREATRSAQSDMGRVITEVKGDLEIDDLLVRAWIEQYADDPKIVKLWDERESRKREFAELIDTMKPEFKKYAEAKFVLNPKGGEKPAQSAKKGLVNAVRNSRESASKGEDDTDWSSLSNQDFETKKRQVFKAAEAGRLK